METVDPRVLDQLIRAHCPALVLYARQFCSTPEDAVQDAIVQLMKQEESPQEPIPWLFRTVRNRSLNLNRSQSRRSRHEQIVRESKPVWFERDLEKGLDAELATKALEELDVELRETLVAKIWGGLSFEQIATLTDTSASTAFRRYERGLADLRDALAIVAHKGERDLNRDS